ncbi:4Fe-4S single cluster domain-containing protein [uncultured Mitsuokella sp.]|uniref:4Fe-4S single cluster domain-containing protein n=1 Tax=uncultured Mitsuokella sp. TaxID=453120 RepID=UPI0026230550|nr:4Fe-4S single cluster domain-containing protein [uncultured Mitsuokella sp.]
MKVARILYPVHSLGPGNRLGIWLAGCPRRCPGCSNPELWRTRADQEISLPNLQRLLRPFLARRDLDGVVVTGGDPFFQPDALLQLLGYLNQSLKDILVYTGYTYEELLRLGQSACACLQHIGVLIDGPYREQENDGYVLKGSANQRIYFLRPELQPRYLAYLAEQHHPIQNFTTKEGVISVGIHRRDFADVIQEQAKKKGMILHDRP